MHSVPRRTAYDQLPETRIIIDDEYHMQNIATAWAPHWSELGGVGELHWFRVKHFLPWPWPYLVPRTWHYLTAAFEGDEHFT